ncbi:hypothetical protein J7K93_01295 [bacterium]|nr:hypothetical protein [bacterium]
MAEKARGSIFYEILIVVFVVGLIFSIVYPSGVWKKEDELQNVCRARMSALNHLEYRYMENTNTFTDSIPKLMKNVFMYPEVVDAIDSSINWDKLVTSKKMAGLIRGLDLPDTLRSEITARLDAGRPLMSLADWDSLELKLIAGLKVAISDSMFQMDSLKFAVDWRSLVGENKFWDIISSDKISARVLNRANRKIQTGKLINEIREWKYYAPLFFGEFKSMLQLAERKDVWNQGQRDQWEPGREEQWMADMDTLSQASRDSLWKQYQVKLWGKNKELLWKDQWKALYAKEKDTWIKENQAVWNRIVEKNWNTERKKRWLKERKAGLPDSLAAIFTSIRDSLWRAERDSIYNNEFAMWEKRNKKQINEIIKNLWESDRRLTWDEEAFTMWVKDNEANPDRLWAYLKAEVWKIEKDVLWRGEERKYNGKISMLKHLNKSVQWQKILGREKVQEIVSGLQLPNSRTMVKLFKNETGKDKSAVYSLGLAPLLNAELLKSVDICPVANAHHIVAIDDTSIVAKFSIKCPIVDTLKTPFISHVDTATGDTINIKLSLPFFEKVFGGGEIRNHGNIDMDGKKSWEKKAR